MTAWNRLGGGGVGHGLEVDIHEQVGGDTFEFGAELGQVAIGGKGESGGGFEEGFAGHGGAEAFGGEFLDVGAACGEGGGDLADDAGAVLADEFDAGEAGGEERWGFVAFDEDGEAGGAEGVEGLAEGFLAVVGQGEAEDAGEFAAQAVHAAFEPVALVFGDQRGQTFHEAGAVTTDDGEDEGGLHAFVVSRRGGGGKDGCGAIPGRGLSGGGTEGGEAGGKSGLDGGGSPTRLPGRCRCQESRYRE